MGNSAWGHGYHKGKKEGGILGMVVAFGSATILAGLAWGANRLKDRGLRKAENLDTHESPPEESETPRD